MLVLSRHRDEKYVIPLDQATLELLLEKVKKTGEPILIENMVVDIRGNSVRMGVSADSEIPVYREEVYSAIKRGIQKSDSISKSPLGNHILRRIQDNMAQ